VPAGHWFLLHLACRSVERRSKWFYLNDRIHGEVPGFSSDGRSDLAREDVLTLGPEFHNRLGPQGGRVSSGIFGL
jgi:hypothetical protein